VVIRETAGLPEQPLDQVLDALANSHRREIVYLLGLQPWGISQLAGKRGLSLPAIHRHIKILEAAGLVSRRKHGRTTYLTLNRPPLVLLQTWVGQFHLYWGSDQASYENYSRHLGFDPAGEDRPEPPLPSTGAPE
jgi:DNA-binding transcriptional ArsR family regulator